MSETRILPCPFCGGEVDIEKKYEEGCEAEGAYYAIKKGTGENACSCKGLFVESYYFDMHDMEEGEEAKKALIKSWNTRKPMQRIVERLEERARQAAEDKTSFEHDGWWSAANRKNTEELVLREIIKVIREEGQI